MNEDTLRAEFEKLTGIWRHYCYDWDELPIDETCPEFASCHCKFDESFPNTGLAEAREAARNIHEQN